MYSPALRDQYDRFVRRTHPKGFFWNYGERKINIYDKPYLFSLTLVTQHRHNSLTLLPYLGVIS